MRRAAIFGALLLLAGCGQPDAAGGAGQDPFAGLDDQVLSWRGDILKTDALCQSQVEGQKCESFDVSCKAQRTITAAAAAKGVTAIVVVSMNWNGWDPKLKQAQMASRAAQFTKTSGKWSRADHPAVNLTSCADL